MSQPKQPKEVVVLGLFMNGATVLRHLSGLGYRVVGVSHKPGEIGFRSRHGRKLLGPDPSYRFEDWVAFMQELARRFDRPPALVPTSDRYVVALEKAAQELGHLYRFHGTPAGLSGRLTSKRGQLELAGQHGFPAPWWQPVDGREALLELADSIRDRGPLLLKPDYAFHWHEEAAKVALGKVKVIVVASEAELLRETERLEGFSRGLIAQELIPGPQENLHYFTGFVRDDGKLAGRIVGRKVRVSPFPFGSASFVQLADEPALEERCGLFLKQMGYVGLCGVEVKRDARDGIFKLIEINPRYGLWEDIGLPVGIDLIREALDALDGERPPPRRPLHFRQKWVAFQRDLPVLPRYLAEGGWTWRRWLASLSPPIVLNDLPVVTDFPYCAEMLRRAVRRLRQRLRRGRPQTTSQVKT